MRHCLIPVLLFMVGCGSEPTEPAAETPEEAPEETVVEAPTPLREVVGEELFEALPTDVELDAAKVLLGRGLFHDRRLSGDETVACSTCHMLSHGGAEPRATSVGIQGQTGPINSPTVINAEHNFRQFWDGRAADLLEQAAGPVTNPIEMGGEWPTILERLGEDEALVTQMQATYGDDPVTQANVLDAIVEYERSLSTPSDFDRWLGGDDDALDEQEQRGLRAFVEIGCTTCHRGRNVGGTMYQRMGLVQNYFERRGGRVTEADLGRFNVTEDAADRHMFKVPTLRNITETGPYFHDGSEAELSGAVRTMALVQLGQELDDEQVGDLVSFLGALSGELPDGAVPPGAGDDADEADESEGDEGEADEGEAETPAE